jgi:hypothetical protein
MNADGPDGFFEWVIISDQDAKNLKTREGSHRAFYAAYNRVVAK